MELKGNENLIKYYISRKQQNILYIDIFTMMKLEVTASKRRDVFYTFYYNKIEIEWNMLTLIKLKLHV